MSCQPSSGLGLVVAIEISDLSSVNPSGSMVFLFNNIPIQTSPVCPLWMVHVLEHPPSMAEPRPTSCPSHRPHHPGMWEERRKVISTLLFIVVNQTTQASLKTSLSMSGIRCFVILLIMCFICLICLVTGLRFHSSIGRGSIGRPDMAPPRTGETQGGSQGCWDPQP